MLIGFLKSLGVYKLYERLLIDQVGRSPMPKHIGVVLDGNRRWAASRALPSILGHEFGAKLGEDFLNWCLELGIRTVTVYAFSTENFSRPEHEVNEILDNIEDQAKRLLKDPKIHNHRVRVKAIGRLDLLPESLRRVLGTLEKTTETYEKHYLNIAVAYGGRAEIVDATKKIVEEVGDGRLESSQITEELFDTYLYTAHLPNPHPDLIIRTSGEERMSGFLLWQSAYSEFCFLDVYWPDFRKIDLLRAIRTYQYRMRRFGR